MSDINTSLSAGQNIAQRSASSVENRREAARVESQPVIETPTNEVANQAAQVTPLEQSDTGSRPGEDGRDPLELAAEQITRIIPEDALNNTSLRIDLDELSGRFIYQSVDSESGEVIRQFPPEELLRLLSIVREAEGLAVDQEA